MADDLDRRLEHLVAAGVVVVEMRVDEETDGLVGQRLQLLQENARASGRNVRVDDEDIVLIDDDGGVQTRRSARRTLSRCRCRARSA